MPPLLVASLGRARARPEPEHEANEVDRERDQREQPGAHRLPVSTRVFCLTFAAVQPKPSFSCACSAIISHASRSLSGIHSVPNAKSSIVFTASASFFVTATLSTSALGTAASPCGRG